MAKLLMTGIPELVRANVPELGRVPENAPVSVFGDGRKSISLKFRITETK